MSSLLRLRCEVCSANLPASLVCDYCKAAYSLRPGGHPERIPKPETQKIVEKVADASAIFDQEVSRRTARILDEHRRIGWSSYRSRQRRQRELQRIAYYTMGLVALWLLYRDGLLRIFGVGP